ncbi:MAG: redoxin family protein [Pseudomonadota bacterium]
MTMRIVSAVSIFLMLALAGLGLCDTPKQISVNTDILASLKFNVPETLADKKYLGLSDGKNFQLPQVKARLLIIQIFSMYCPVCQRDAHAVNELHDLLQKVPGLRDEVKMIGVGTGNTPYEVNVFREKFKVAFPLIPDDNFAIQKALSDEIRTPTFLVVKPTAEGKLEIVLTKVGEINESGEFLKRIMAKLN